MKRKITAILLVVALVLSFGLVPAASVGASPDPGIVGLWHFDGDADDSSGNGNNGTASGTPGWVSDQWTGQALSCSGDDYVSVPDDDDLDISGSIMVEAWVKVTSLTSGKFYTVAGKWNDVDGNYRAYLLGITAKTTTPEFRFYISSDGTNFDWVPSSRSVNTGTWYHLAGSFDGDILTICVNGTVDTNDTSLSSIATNSEPLLIGGNKAGGATAAVLFNGLIDEVRIWDTATPSFNLDATPVEDFNPVGDDHEVTADVTITRTDVGTEPAPGVEVNFDVISGPNSGDSDSDYTDSTGEAEFTYSSSDDGKDTIRVWVDQDCSGDFDDAEDAWVEVEKYWLENFVTGGGKINMSTLGLNGKKAALTFGGTVGVMADSSIVGQFQIVDHTVKGGEAWHCGNGDFSFLNFDGDPIVGPPGPSSTHSIAIFTGTFTSNRGSPPITVTITIKDLGEPGKGVDMIMFDGLGPFVIDGGNFQVHDIEE